MRDQQACQPADRQRQARQPISELHEKIEFATSIQLFLLPVRVFLPLAVLGVKLIYGGVLYWDHVRKEVRLLGQSIPNYAERLVSQITEILPKPTPARHFDWPLPLRRLFQF